MKANENNEKSSINCLAFAKLCDVYRVLSCLAGGSGIDDDHRLEVGHGIILPPTCS
jgi:hypothetical protein